MASDDEAHAHEVGLYHLQDIFPFRSRANKAAELALERKRVEEADTREVVQAQRPEEVTLVRGVLSFFRPVLCLSAQVYWGI